MVDNWSTRLSPAVLGGPAYHMDSSLDDIMGVAALAPQFDRTIDTPRRSARPIGSLSPDRRHANPTLNLNSFASSVPKSYCPLPPTSTANVHASPHALHHNPDFLIPRLANMAATAPAASTLLQRPATQPLRPQPPPYELFGLANLDLGPAVMPQHSALPSPPPPREARLAPPPFIFSQPRQPQPRPSPPSPSTTDSFSAMSMHPFQAARNHQAAQVQMAQQRQHQSVVPPQSQLKKTPSPALHTQSSQKLQMSPMKKLTASHHQGSHLQQQATAQSNVHQLPSASSPTAVQAGSGPSPRTPRDLPHPTRCVLVRNLPPGVDDDDLRRLLSLHGELRDLGAQQRARGGRGSVMATFYDLRHAREAVRAIDGTMHFGRRLDARFQCPTDVVPTNGTVANHGTLVVFNLDASTAADEVRTLFSSIGDVKEIRATPNKKHHKFVEFYDIRDAERALQALNKTEVAGKRIKIEISRPGGRAAGAARAAALAAQAQAHGTNGNGNGGVANGSATSPKKGNTTQSGVSMASQSHAQIQGQSRPNAVQNVWRSGARGIPTTAATSPVAVPKTRPALSMEAELDNLAASFPPLGLSDNTEAQSLDRSSSLLTGRGPSFDVGEDQDQRRNARLYSLGLTSFASSISPVHELDFSSDINGSDALFNRASPRDTYMQVLNNSPSSDGAGSSGSAGTLEGSSPPSSGGPLRSFDEVCNSNGLSEDLLRAIGGVASGVGNNNPSMHGHGHSVANGNSGNGHAYGAGQHNHSHGHGVGQVSHLQNGIGGGHGHGHGHGNGKFTLDLDRVRNGEETRTALMIRNIPNKYNQKMLVSTLEERHKGHFDFIYLPIDFKNKCNVGYAFINMTKPIHIESFYQAFHGKKWGRFNSEKVCEITFARIQGRQQLIAHFQNSSLLLEDPKCRPVIFDLYGRQEEFPVGMHVRTRRGPCSRDATMGPTTPSACTPTTPTAGATASMISTATTTNNGCVTPPPPCNTCTNSSALLLTGLTSGSAALSTSATSSTSLSGTSAASSSSPSANILAHGSGTSVDTGSSSG